MPAILHVDVEAFLVGAYTDLLAARPEAHAAGVAVRQRVPDESSGDPWPASGRLVVVRDDGGPGLGDVRAAARIGVRVWGANDAESYDLAALVAALTGALENTGPVRRVVVSRPYSVPEQSGRPAHYFTAELAIRGVSL